MFHLQRVSGIEDAEKVLGRNADDEFREPSGSAWRARDERLAPLAR